MDDETNTDETGGKVSRRDALKKGAVGAGVVGIVWAAPAIEGLSMQPSYAAAGSLSQVACSGGVNFNLALPCPAPGHSAKDVAPGGNCGTQGLTADTHFADAHPHDSNKSVADQFDKVTVNDGNGQFLLFNVKRNTGNTHCKFTAVTFDGISTLDPTNNPGGHPFNPTNHTPNGRPTKFNGAFQTSDQIAIGFGFDPNERGDVERIACQGTAHITLTCT